MIEKKKTIHEDIDAISQQYHQEVITKPPAIVKHYGLSEFDINVLAALLVAEAGGEPQPERAMTAVMNVIVNRAKHNPRDYLKQATKPLQFSALNPFTRGIFYNLSPRTKLRDFIQSKHHHAKFKLAQLIAAKAGKGQLPDITKGATHYHVYAGNSKVTPSWTHPKLGGKNNRAAICGYLGHHVFLKI